MIIELTGFIYVGTPCNTETDVVWLVGIAVAKMAEQAAAISQSDEERTMNISHNGR